jgi:hypothetical protein
LRHLDACIPVTNPTHVVFFATWTVGYPYYPERGIEASAWNTRQPGILALGDQYCAL